MIEKYQETLDDNNRICPYCLHSCSCQVEAEDYSEETSEEECSSCGKKYYSHNVFSVTHYAHADCELNGEVHKWEPVKCRNGFHDFCSVCGTCRRVKKQK